MINVLLACFGVANAATRIGTFIVLGDWGYDANVHCQSNWNCHMKSTCQRSIANKMKEWHSQNSDLKFVINVGDSFYPTGISSYTDSKWNDRWRYMYGVELTNKRWYSVYGNHDYEGQDKCACGDPTTTRELICAQRKAPVGGWFMPELYYYDTTFQNELDVEIVALDTNSVAESACHYQPCSSNTCWANMNGRYRASMDLFSERLRKTTAKNLLVFSHYPTGYFNRNDRRSFLDGLRSRPNGGRTKITYFGGHGHNVDQHQTSISPNVNWMVGGGGGWGCDGPDQGFVVGTIYSDGTLTTKSVLVSPSTCCYNYRTDGSFIKRAPDEPTIKSDEWWEDLFSHPCDGAECEERAKFLTEFRNMERLKQEDTDRITAKLMAEMRANQTYTESAFIGGFPEKFMETIDKLRTEMA